MAAERGGGVRRKDAVLSVGLEDDQLVIRIGIATLAFALTAADEPLRVVDARLAAEEIVRVLTDEEEDGTTPVHRLLDKAGLAAWENGGEGFAEVDGDA